METNGLDMFFYRESDGHILREYKVIKLLESIETDKALIEIMDTQEFGYTLFIDGQLQMSMKDEYIYHEMLVHPVMSLFNKHIHICILGGGDGCAAREVLKWGNAKTIEIFDYDQKVIELFQHKFSSWNGQSLTHQNVQVNIDSVLDIPAIQDYDVLIVDLTDPCYDDITSKTLWENLFTKLSTVGANSAIVLNIGGYLPWDEKDIDWIIMLLASAFQNNKTHTVESYKVFVPSFAREWCFLLIKPIGTSVDTSLFENTRVTRYFNKNAWSLATTWTKDSPSLLPKQPVNLKDFFPSL
jgi:spermidine synthase